MPRTRERPERTPRPAGRCAVCGGLRVERHFFAKGIPVGEPRFQVVGCPECGHRRTQPELADHEIARFYPPAYYGKENVRFHPAIELLVRVFRWRRAQVIHRRARHGRVLDVGCGRGFILGYLKRLGWEVHGVELSDHAAWHARHRIGARVHVGDFTTAPYGAESFEAVIFWHSLEHFRKPQAALRHAAALLKRGGLLVVAVPNSDSLQAALGGRNWFHLDVPRHYEHFTLRSLELSLIRNGFKVVQRDHFSFEQNPYGWLQTLCNALGFEFDFLYMILKDRGFRRTSVLRHPLQALGLLATLPILAPLSIALTTLEAGLRRGGTVEVYAMKE